MNNFFKNILAEAIDEYRAKSDTERQNFRISSPKDKWVGRSVGKGSDKHMEYDYYQYQHGTTPHQELPDFQPKLKPIILYKQFKLRLDNNGNNLSKGMVFPLYVKTDSEGDMGLPQGLQLGKWYKSGEGECWLNTENNRLYTVGRGYDTDGNKIDNLAYRPGWHMTTTPWGNQRGDGKVKDGKKGTGNNYQFTRNSEVWGKVEVCVDINATEKARSMSETPADQCLQKLGDSEYYEYRTNSNATKDQTWYIVDKIRIIEILDDDSVDSINNEFYTNLSKQSGRKIDSDPRNYVSSTSKDIPYWKMPRTNGIRYSKQNLKDMGYIPQDASHGDWEKSELNESIDGDEESKQALAELIDKYPSVQNLMRIGKENSITVLFKDETKIPVEHVKYIMNNKLFKYVIAIKNHNDEIQYYTVVSLGKNGSGSLEEDLLELLEIIRDTNLEWVDMCEGQRDIPDDLSDWVLTFTLD